MKIDESEIIETNDYRVIIYPASRPFTPKESKAIAEDLYEFLGTWAAHGKPLSASFKIVKNQFVIIAVDEEKELASGCSIDALSAVFRRFESEGSFGFFDRMKACFLKDGEVVTMKLQDFRNALKNKELDENIEVFDFSKSTYVNFLSDFLLPLKRSWAQIYITKKRPF